MITRIAAIIAASLLVSACAGYTSIHITCSPQLDQATVSSGAAAAFCPTVTITGSPTATATTTTTVPVQAPIGPGAGLGLGPNVTLPPMSGAVVMPLLGGRQLDLPISRHSISRFGTRKAQRTPPNPASAIPDYSHVDELFRPKSVNPWLATIFPP